MSKRSITIRGHATSFTLEDEFWNELQSIAQQRSISIAQLVTQIDAKRAPDQNLSSALRIFILENLKSRLFQ